MSIDLGKKTVIQMESLFCQEKKPGVQERMSTRMVKCAGAMDCEDAVGWQILVPVKGEARMSVFGTDSYCSSDLAWIAGKLAKVSKEKRQRANTCPDSLQELWEIRIPEAESCGHTMKIGFCAQPDSRQTDSGKWPMYTPDQFGELLSALRETGAMIRVTVSAADSDAQETCRKNALQTLPLGKSDAREYIGTPVRIRALLRLPAAPSVRLRTVLAAEVPGCLLKRIGSMDQAEAAGLWQEPQQDAPVLPEFAARILTMEPVIYENVIGISCAQPEMKDLPCSLKKTAGKKAIVIGRAIGLSGTQMRVSIGEEDLKRHCQIIGQTGTGKSTLLAGMIICAIRLGYGLTFYDPHGSTIDWILRSLPKEYADRVRVVRIGDVDHPVPMALWDSDDYRQEERTINDLCELFADIFDPKHEGIVGPRFERWFSTFAKASIALLGRRASLEAITVLSGSRVNMRKLYEAIREKHPDLAQIIQEEYGKDSSSDFASLLNWLMSKFQRLTGVEQLRKTLGAGANALDFAGTIDSDTVTLIDLSAPVIGTHAARVAGTLIMMKLWNAALTRKDRDKTHLVVVDEASLFQTNPVPRMLAEGRKFGISMVLCHQHTGQLTKDVCDALEANAANFTAFRLSPRDAAEAALRFDDPQLRTGLARLDAFRAVTSISAGGQQTPPFTLRITKPPVCRDGEETAARIEKASIASLVEPYRDQQALTRTQIQEYLDHPNLLEQQTDLAKAFSKMMDSANLYEDLLDDIASDGLQPHDYEYEEAEENSTLSA